MTAVPNTRLIATVLGALVLFYLTHRSPSKSAASKSVAKVKLYGMATATCTRRVLMTLEEKGVPYELIVVDLSRGEQKLPAYLLLQPFGQVPYFEDGDVHLFESRAIVRYIANKWANQGTDLLGRGVQARAATDTWLEVEAQNFNPPVSTLVFEHVFKAARGGGPADPKVLFAQLTKLNSVLDVYEKVLQTQPYLAGQHFSLADLSHLPYTAALLKAGVSSPFNSRPAVKAWWTRISTRPSWKKIVAA